ncbi:MAG: FHA domain-containing protein [Phycisphaerales bacterium]|nr:FHA domain-containing protein [Phycisphaerales bacterium]
MYELIVTSTSGEVLRKFDLARLAKTGRAIRVGRADDCDIRIKNNAVSRHHCEILPPAVGDEEEDWLIRDTGSTGGVVVGGRKIDELEIESGLEVVVGPAILRFQSQSAKIAAELAKELGSEE